MSWHGPCCIASMHFYISLSHALTWKERFWCPLRSGTSGDSICDICIQEGCLMLDARATATPMRVHASYSARAMLDTVEFAPQSNSESWATGPVLTAKAIRHACEGMALGCMKSENSNGRVGKGQVLACTLHWWPLLLRGTHACNSLVQCPFWQIAIDDALLRSCV